MEKVFNVVMRMEREQFLGAEHHEEPARTVVVMPTVTSRNV